MPGKKIEIIGREYEIPEIDSYDIVSIRKRIEKKSTSLSGRRVTKSSGKETDVQKRLQSFRGVVYLFEECVSQLQKNRAAYLSFLHKLTKNVRAKVLVHGDEIRALETERASLLANSAEDNDDSTTVFLKQE